MCKYCEKGTANKYGEEIFQSFPLESKSFIYHDSPYIKKTNNKYFMYIENFYAIEIKGCPMCGKKF